MKKITTIIVLLLGICLVGCQSHQSSSQDSTSLINNQGAKVTWDDTGLFLSFAFDDMYMNMIFNDDNPKEYFAMHPLTADQIKTVQIYPCQEESQEFIYMIYKDGKYQIDQQDLEDYQDQGRKEAYQKYQQKLDDLKVTTDDIGNAMVTYFNEQVRQELISDMKNRIIELKNNLKQKGYDLKEDNGRIIITKNRSRYKIVIVASSCMVVNQDMDLSGGAKTGYLYTPKKGTVGYIVSDQSQVIYRYKDNSILQGTPSLKQYSEFQEIKKWYDQFLYELNTNTDELESL
ncbi:MAG: hypothetical protein ACLUVC_00265 [Longibaculum sp.]